MGQILSQPVTTKESEEGGNDRLSYGVSSMQGWRVTMEDAHSVVLDMNKAHDIEGSEEDEVAFFGVFDGHGGSKVAIYTGEHLNDIIAGQKAYKEKKYANALIDGFLSTDRRILQDPSFDKDVSGCTATTAIITNKRIITANAGDSRTILGVRGQAKPLSFDHKPQNEGEKARICAAGGFVDKGRVNGNLALSRAIGDFDFKRAPTLPPEEQVVTAYPDVIEHAITPDDEFVVLACDGIWDCMNSQSVVKFVRRGIAEGYSLLDICERLIDECLAPYSDISGIGCDNMTVMIVALLNGQTQEEWYSMVTERVKNGDGPAAPAYFFTKASEHAQAREAAAQMHAEQTRINFPAGQIRGGEGLMFDKNIIQRLLGTPIGEDEEIHVELPNGDEDLPTVIGIEQISSSYPTHVGGEHEDEEENQMDERIEELPDNEQQSDKPADKPSDAQ